MLLEPMLTNKISLGTCVHSNYVNIFIFAHILKGTEAKYPFEFGFF